ncbi:hypothetical protein SpCBS45565_g00703 [Spizellomyces sp. 'palustris']|nr:hypothetical protein SpCBS45565_g00703 [Spizellomyces sp. 'palustris']
MSIPSTPSESSSEQTFEEKLQEYVDALLRLGISVHDFETENAESLFDQIDGLVDDLNELDALKEQVDIEVPGNVLDQVEDGANPDILVRDWAQTLVDKNQKTHGHICALQELHDQIQNEMKLHFPNLIHDHPNPSISEPIPSSQSLPSPLHAIKSEVPQISSIKQEPVTSTLMEDTAPT